MPARSACSTGATFDASATSYSPIVTVNVNGSGHILGNATLPQGASLTPGADGTAGTLAFANNLTVSSITLNSDLGATGTVGGGVNDLVDVTGQLTLNGTNTLNPNFLGTPTVGSYPLIRYGTKTGAGTFTLPTNLQLRGTASVDFSQANLISLAITAITPGNLVWRGTGNNGGIWDLANHANWIFNSGNSQFFQFDNVSFLDTTGAPSTVNLLSTVEPSSIVVNSSSAFNYNIGGPGTIIGPGALTKSGNSTLTLQISNSFTGGATLSGGAINVGTFGSTALGTGPINLNGGTLISTGTGTVFFSSNINVNSATSTLTINGTGAVGNISGNLGGNGTLELVSDNTGKLFDLGGSNTTFGGGIIVTGTQTIRLSTNGGSGLATWSLPNGGTISANAGTSSSVTTIPLGALNGNAASTLKGYNAGGSGGNIAYQLGDANVPGTFAGNIIDGASGATARPVSIIKSGTSTQTLSGSNSYTGVTQVNSGTLVLTGSNAWTPISHHQRHDRGYGAEWRTRCLRLHRQPRI